MCGIVGIASENDCVKRIISGFQICYCRVVLYGIIVNVNLTLTSIKSVVIDL